LIVTRLAPTPSGYLHPGNAVSFLLTWALARAKEGKLLLRIDDLDQGRYRREYVEDIFRTLEWLGIECDEGPSDVAGLETNYSQLTRLDAYREALLQLRQEGYLYACDCTRKRIREISLDGRYPGSCRERALPFEQEPIAWRVRLAKQGRVGFREWRNGRREYALEEWIDDFVVRQKNGMPAYQLASLIDDEYFGINLVVRGEDLLPSTIAQQHLARLLDISLFQATTFWHHPLLTAPDGTKLSKSSGAGALKAWREAGRKPQELHQLAARWIDERAVGVDSLAGLVEWVAIQNFEF